MSKLVEKQNAVMTLLEESVLLSYEQKLDIVDMFPKLSAEQIDALGSFLSAEERIREEFSDDIEEGVKNVLAKIATDELDDEDNRVYVGSGKAG